MMIAKFTRFPHASRASSLVPQAHWVSPGSLFPQKSQKLAIIYIPSFLKDVGIAPYPGEKPKYLA
ncbi:hypothetical protein BpJC7_12490 [Weizmannia acidilactici]|uniref:Uncharacterized protein n=1 Tax=Weizmannia acidilactici TaxID=2607726 RepID=A0A5J4J4P9_9BACI|nr:hypothetical protein BpJC4_03410 [Weizmannia acidilactici]GER69946.1 hypothetical protein BpJC7_12490 [Weizmannia acidilactici]GER73121.1 hypothetical protein BpPP18_11880 [Weizmannia acidilactici]